MIQLSYYFEVPRVAFASKRPSSLSSDNSVSLQNTMFESVVQSSEHSRSSAGSSGVYTARAECTLFRERTAYRSRGALLLLFLTPHERSVSWTHSSNSLNRSLTFCSRIPRVGSPPPVLCPTMSCHGISGRRQALIQFRIFRK